MTHYIVACSKDWCSKKKLSPNFTSLDVSFVTSQEELTIENLNKFSPKYIFFLHWNWIVSKEIHENFECIVFHVAPLPIGRGGSPLQNLISRGYEIAPLCALRMTEIIDGGPIYCSENISLKGTIEEIFVRVGEASERLIKIIIRDSPAPVPQNGTPTNFRRRQPEDSELPSFGTLQSLFDHIRMLDGPEYPKAFIQYGDFKLEFRGATVESNTLKADVLITKKVNPPAVKK